MVGSRAPPPPRPGHASPPGAYMPTLGASGFPSTAIRLALSLGVRDHPDFEILFGAYDPSFFPEKCIY